MLGSRYVAGGRVGNWGPLRRFISRGGSLYAQILLGLPIRDLTGGFKCYRRAVLEALRSTTSTRRATRSRSRRRTARCERASACARSRSPSSTARGRLEDVEGDRRRGGLEGARAPARRAPRRRLLAEAVPARAPVPAPRRSRVRPLVRIPVLSRTRADR